MNLKLNWNLKQILKQYQDIQNYNNLGGDTENDNKCYVNLISWRVFLSSSTWHLLAQPMAWDYLFNICLAAQL